MTKELRIGMRVRLMSVKEIEDAAARLYPGRIRVDLPRLKIGDEGVIIKVTSDGLADCDFGACRVILVNAAMVEPLPHWTVEPPTEPGFYWTRPVPGIEGKSDVVYVRKSGLVHGISGLVQGISGMVTVKVMAERYHAMFWSEPIAPPSEEPQL